MLSSFLVSVAGDMIGGGVAFLTSIIGNLYGFFI